MTEMPSHQTPPPQDPTRQTPPFQPSPSQGPPPAPPFQGPQFQAPYRQLRRPVTDRMLAGVASGLGRYFAVDPTLVRVVFAVAVVLTGGVALLAYPVMWFLMPAEPAGAPAWPHPAPGWTPPAGWTQPAPGTGPVTPSA